MSDQEHTFRILTLGESGVGKTSILLRFTDNKFLNAHLITIGIDFKSKVMNFNNQTVKLKIWDTAGQEKFKNITQQYYKGAHGIFLIYDISDMYSFEKLREWMSQIQSYVNKEKVRIVLLGNKCDLDKDCYDNESNRSSQNEREERKRFREVSFEDGEEFAKEFNIPFFETSACENVNINKAFERIVFDIMTYRDKVKEEGSSFRDEKSDFYMKTKGNENENENDRKTVVFNGKKEKGCCNSCC